MPADFGNGDDSERRNRRAYSLLVLRAVQCGFGAEQALRAAVQLGACEMLKAGASLPGVRQAIAQCVLSHPSVLPDKLSLISGESYASAILKRMLVWTDNVVLTPQMHATRRERAQTVSFAARFSRRMSGKANRVRTHRDDTP